MRKKSGNCGNFRRNNGVFMKNKTSAFKKYQLLEKFIF